MNHPDMDIERLTSQARLGLRSGPRASRKAVAWLGFLISIFGFASQWLSFGYVGGAQGAGDRFLDAMGAHDYHTALSLCSADSAANAWDLERREEGMEQAHGGYVSHGPSGWSLLYSGGPMTVQIKYTAECAGGAGNVRLVMVREGGRWRVLRYVYPEWDRIITSPE